MRPALIDPMEVALAGIPVAQRGPRTRELVLHRGHDGCWQVVDPEGVADLPEGLRERAVAMAASVLGGLDVTGRTVTSVQVEGGLSWVGLRRGRRACSAGLRRRGGRRC